MNQETLKAIFHYDPSTGIFTWLVSKRPGWVGKQAGTLSAGGYIKIKINGKQHNAHRLAHLYMTGEWPEDIIDHEDGIGSNNKWINIRSANMSQNKANSRLYKNSTTGLKGVYKMKHGRYVAKIQRKGKRIAIGYYDTAKEAHEAYVIAAQSLFGEFARAA